MDKSLRLFVVVMTLSDIFFVASICTLIYYKRKNFELKGETTVFELAKKLTTVSFVINVSVLITLVTTWL